MPSTVAGLQRKAELQGNPIGVLQKFLKREEEAEAARKAGREKMRFVGYVLDIGYEAARIITSDPYKMAVGGVPRGSFLIMTPVLRRDDSNPPPLHFSLLRVSGVSPTPLAPQVQQTYFELHKRAMPELDVWTQGELQWGALDCEVLGMFYGDPKDTSKLAFSGDVNNVVSAHRYKVFAPDQPLLDLIVNGLVPSESRATLGELRPTECGLSSEAPRPTVPVKVSMADFRGRRTAMFGKTRLGKSNVVKLIAQGMLDATATDNSVGQLIFDIDGEYANDNPQDANISIRSKNESRCQVYALVKRSSTPSKPLRLNFYEQPESCFSVIRSMLALDNRTSDYVRSFANVTMPSIGSIADLPHGERTRPVRRVQMYWAILRKAGFPADEKKLCGLGLSAPQAKHFDPHFHDKARRQVYQAVAQADPPANPNSLDALVAEFEIFAQYVKENGPSGLASSSDRPLFEPDDIALLNFLAPAGGRSGPTILRAYLGYHDPNAGDFIADILQLLDAGKTVILDLGNATDELRRYFADMLSKEVFAHQEKKFVSNRLAGHFIQLYFEEAHSLFPMDDKEMTSVYARFAKEGAKFHIGMVYSTQSPSTINRELLAQTENFFVGHVSSQHETQALSRLQVAFAGHEPDILRTRTPGYMRMLTQAHRFVIPVQARKFAVEG
jgi:Helicase HerA, central domain